MMGIKKMNVKYENGPKLTAVLREGESNHIIKIMAQAPIGNIRMRYNGVNGS
jgi:hypothetical protein